MTTQPPIKMLPLEEAIKLRGSGPVPSAPYFDPAWWELEREAIFMRNWLHIGHVCELPEPGNFVRRDIEFARASLLIVRGRDNEIRAFHNTCTHRGTQLVADAQGKRANFSCPYHMWTFASDGRLLAAPDFERFHLAKEDCSLKKVALEICAGMIFINFAREPQQSLREFLGDIADELEKLPVAKATSFSEYHYEIAANWKMNFDNFQENYHVRFIHPRTGEQTLSPENPFGYPVAYGFSGPHRSQTLWKNSAPPPLPAAQQLALTQALKLAQQDNLYSPKTDFKLFPCLHIVGQALYFFSHTMTPIDAERTRGTIRMYWVAENDSASRAFTREYLMMMVRDIHTEDRDIVEAGQRGIRGIDKVNFQDHEILLRHLYEEVTARVDAYVEELKQGSPATSRQKIRSVAVD